MASNSYNQGNYATPPQTVDSDAAALNAERLLIDAALTSIEGLLVAEIHHNTQIAAVDKFKLFIAPAACVVSKVQIVAGALAGTPASNYFSINVNRIRAGAANVTLLSTAYAMSSAEADTVIDLGADQNLTLAANDILELELTAETGNATIDDLLIQVLYTPVAVS